MNGALICRISGRIGRIKNGGLSLRVFGPAVNVFKMAAKTKPKDVRSLMKERNKSKKKIDSPLARYYIYKSSVIILSIITHLSRMLQII